MRPSGEFGVGQMGFLDPARGWPSLPTADHLTSAMQVPSQMTTRLLCLRCLSSSQARHTSLENDDSIGGLKSNLSIREGGPRFSLPCRVSSRRCCGGLLLSSSSLYGLRPLTLSECFGPRNDSNDAMVPQPERRRRSNLPLESGEFECTCERW